MHKLLTVIFLITISLPLVGYILKVNQNLQIQENRTLTQSFDDQFGFRPIPVRLNSLIRFNLFHSSTNNLVTIGDEGRLFYSFKDTYLDDLGLSNFSETELETIRKNLDQTREYLTQRGIKSYFLIAPKPQAVYPEYLPSYYQPGKTRLMQLQGEFTDPTKALQASKNLGPLYYKYDTHWNYLGAFVAYQELMRGMGIKPLELDEFSITYQESPHKDLAILLGMSDYLTEQEPILTPKNPHSHQVSPPCSNIYAQCLDVVMEADQPGPRALVYRDSFGTFLIPYLSEHFSTVHYNWRLAPHPLSDVEKELPDIVIFEITERDLAWLLKPILEIR
jgi:alginate O-acetyltransferase complex protein AlgJ